MRRWGPLFCGIGVLVFVTGLRPPTPPPTAEERNLTEAGLAVDNASLLDFLRKRTLDANGISKIKSLVDQLGDRSFQVREKATAELIALDKPAAPFLRNALNSPDPEVVRRCQDCLRLLEQKDARGGLAHATIRLLAARNPPDTVPVLLDYLPFAMAESDSVGDEVRLALAAVAAPKGQADSRLLAALVDPAPLRRGAAAEALAGIESASVRHQVRALLADSDLLVRARVALALAARDERAGFPVLIDLLDKVPIGQAWQAEDLLLRVAGASAPRQALGKDEKTRKRCREAWAVWWQGHGPSLDPLKLKEAGRFKGYTLLVMLDAGRAVELDARNVPRLAFEGLAYPLDAQMLPGDRLLSAEHHANRVAERDARGEVIWEFRVTEPLMAQRLPNGHTFIASAQQLLEVDREGTEVFNLSFTSTERVMKAYKLQNGDIACIVCLANDSSRRRFVQIDSSRRERTSFPVNVVTFGGRLEVLANGHVLAPERDLHRVVEYDSAGQVIWKVEFHERGIL